MPEPRQPNDQSARVDDLQPAGSVRGPDVSEGTRSGFGLGRFFGIPVRIDWSLLIIFGLIVFDLGIWVLPTWHVDWTPALTWTMAFATAVAFFASVVIHELSHALVARAQGIPVRRITLFLFGGVTELEAEPSSPKSEFWMAVVGPLVSGVIGLAALFGGIALAGEPLQAAIDTETLDPRTLASAVATAGPLATLLLWLGPINLLLALFNTIPGFPLDGGRVLRSVLWAITGNLRKATRWASRIGQVFAWTLMVLGVIDFFSGSWASGLWLLLIGWFLNHAAQASYQQLVVSQALADVPVARVMRSNFVSVPPDLTVEAFVRDYVFATDQDVYPVQQDGQRDGVLLGTMGIAQVRRLAHDAWPTTTVQQQMTPADELPALAPNVSADRALTALSRGDVDQVVVLDPTEPSRLLGLIRRDDLVRWLSLST